MIREDILQKFPDLFGTKKINGSRLTWTIRPKRATGVSSLRPMSMVAPHKKPDEASPHQGPRIPHTLFLAVTWIIKGLLRAGIPMGPMILLTVRGRKSGEPRTTPVDLFERGGRSFLVSTHRQESSNWVRNLRTAGEGVLTRGWSRRAITVVELSPDVAGQVLKEVLDLAWHRRWADSSFDAPSLYHQTPLLRTSLARPGAIPSSSLSLPGEVGLPRRPRSTSSKHPGFEVVSFSERGFYG
jgi:deazaflavin-dependent oxidoreductase (nitroreductase family)